MAVARGSVSARHPEVPRLGLLRELQVLSGTAKWGEAARTRRSGGPGTPRKKGALAPDLPRRVLARGLRGPSDHAAGSSRIANRGVQAPGGAGHDAPGARMSLALALGKGPGGRRRSRAPSGEANASAALWALAPCYFLYRSERVFQEEVGLGGQGFFFLSKAFRQRLAARSPPGAHGSPGGRAPGAGLRGGRCWAEAPGAGAQPQGAASVDWGCGRAAPEEPAGKLKRKVYNLAKSRVEERRSLLLRALPAEGQVGRTRALPRALAAQGATALPPARRGLKIAHEQPQTRYRAPPPHP